MNKEQREKSWCFDNGVTKEQVKAAWDNALKLNIPVVVNLSKNRYTWTHLPPHLLEQLMDRYLPKAIDSTESA